MSVRAQPRLLLAHSHRLVLDVLAKFLSSHYSVSTVLNGTAFLQKVTGFRPNGAILELSMPDMDGLMIARKALSLRPSMSIIFLTRQEESHHQRRAVQVGAKALVSKQASAEELLQIVGQVLDGQTLLNHKPSRELVATLPSLDMLTLRQKQVLRLIATGHRNKEIAHQFGISSRTVELHRAALMQRLSLDSTADLTRFAIENGLV